MKRSPGDLALMEVRVSRPRRNQLGLTGRNFVTEKVRDEIDFLKKEFLSLRIS